MANYVNSNSDAYIYIKLANFSCVHGAVQTSRVDLLNDVERVQELEEAEVVEEAMQDEFENYDEDIEDADLEGILLGRECEDIIIDQDNEFHDSDYSFNGETYEEDGEDPSKIRADIEVEGDLGRVGSDNNVDSEYARSEELQSCSSSDEKCLVPVRPRYAEFNEGVDMKLPII